MNIGSVAEIKAKFSAYLTASEGGPVVVTRHGKPVAVIVGVRDADDLERLLMAHSPRMQAALEAARDQVRDGKTLSHEEIWSDVESAASPGRSARRRRRRRTAG